MICAAHKLIVGGNGLRPYSHWAENSAQWAGCQPLYISEGAGPSRPPAAATKGPYRGQKRIFLGLTSSGPRWAPLVSTFVLGKGSVPGKERRTGGAPKS